MYYKFEERNSCPQCGGALSHVGSVNTLDMQSFGNGSITSDNNPGDDNKPVVNINMRIQ